MTGAKTRRALIALLAFGLIITLAVLLIQPFRHPRAHLMVVRGPRQHHDKLDSSVHLSAQPFLEEDVAALDPLARVLSGGARPAIPRVTVEDPSDIQTLRENVERLTVDRRDVLIVYTAGWGLTRKAVPFLTFPSKSQSDRENRIPMRLFLNQFSDCRAGVKLLIVNAGPAGRTTSPGIINEFPRLLKQAVEETRDSSMWVLFSHGTGEQSHAAHALHRSVFSAFVSRGLLGAADLDGGGTVTIDELFRYVAANVSHRVRHSTGGNISQHPRLFWGGGLLEPAMAAVATLVPVPKEPVPGTGETTPTVASPTETPVPGTNPISPPQLAPARRPTPSAPAATAAAASLPTQNVSDDQGTSAGNTTPEGKKTASTKEETNPSVSPSAESSPPPSQSSASQTPKRAAQTPASNDRAEATSEDASAKAAGTDVNTAAEDSAQSPADLLARAWRLTHNIESAGTGGGPILYAPHLWRTFQKRLINLESVIRAASPSGKNVSRKSDPRWPALRRTVNALSAIEAGHPNLSDDAPRILRSIHEAKPRIDLDPASVTSLGMAERFVQPLPREIEGAIQRFDRLLQSGSRQDMRKWVEKLPPMLRQYSESQITRRLVPLADVEWNTVRLAIRVRRLAEQVAANPWTTQGPYRDTIEQADRFRRAGERTLLDRIGSNRGLEARRRLREARRLYQQVRDDVRNLEAIARLQHELSFRARWYTDWSQAGGSATGVPQAADLLSLLRSLRTMTAELYAKDPPDITTLRRLASRLGALQTVLEAGLEKPDIEMLTGPPFVPPDGWKTELLLKTPLPSSTARMKLLDRADAIHLAVADWIRGATIPDRMPDARSLTSDDWQRYQRSADLEMERLRLALVPRSDEDEALADVQSQYDRFQSLIDQAANSAAGQSNPFPALRNFESALENAYRVLEKSVRQDLSDLAGAPRSDTESPLFRTDAALHALRVCGGAEIDISDIRQPASERLRYHGFRLVRRQHERLIAARSDAPSAELSWLNEAAEKCRRLARRLAGRQPNISDSVTRASIDGPTSVALLTRARAKLRIECRAAAAKDIPGWIILDYDPRRLRVAPTGRQTVYRRDPLRETLRNRSPKSTSEAPPPRAAEYPLRPDLASLSSTFTIPAGAPVVLPLEINKLPGAAGPARLIVKLLVDGEMVRHEIEIALPRAPRFQVGLAGAPETWSERNGILTLLPFPNQTTNYQVSLVNSGSPQRKVAVELFALQSQTLPTLPNEMLPTEAADRILDELNLENPLLRVSEVALPATGKAVPIPFPKLPAKTARKSAESSSGDASPPNGPPGAMAAIGDGMLLILRDPESEHVLLKPVRVQPQSPRRFLRVKTGYDLSRERVEVTVIPENPALLPPSGVSVRMRFARSIPNDAEKRLEALLVPPDDEARLYASVPTRPGRVETIFLDIDGVPRAFVYRINCDADRRNVPEVTDRLSVRIAGLPEGTAYPSDRDSIPVDLRVDAPLGSFRTDQDFVEIGIDGDQDGEFRDESPLRLHADRQVEAALAKTTPKGNLAIATRVGDYSLALPVRAVKNRRVNVLARVHAAGRSDWSRAVEVVFDGTPPRVDRIRLNPARHVTLGKPVIVRIDASDAGLSGVNRVRAAFDVQRTGRIGTKPPPVAATRNQQGQWQAVLPTEGLTPDAYSILVQATDRVGNTSRTARARIEVLTPQEADAMRKAAAVTRISGLVLMSGRAAPNIDVTLAAEKDKGSDFAPTQSDANGAFEFTAVPPGEYTVTASGTVHNKTRTTTTKVTIAPKPNSTTIVEMRLE